jgi:hypothetical protein
MSLGPSHFVFIKPVTAATLGTARVVPMSNLATMQTNYDIIFTTATTATIRTIEINFGSNFNIASATRYIENSGIGSGSLSVSGSILIYTVNNPVTIPVGTNIRLEIARIVANFPGNFMVSITTKNTGGNVIDGPTPSSLFQIFGLGTNGIADNSITGKDISTGFMIRKTLDDDTAGHARGWNPDASTTTYAIFDPDISSASDNEFVSATVRNGNLVFCTATTADIGLFAVYCNSAPGDSAKLDYIITKLPAHVVTSASSSSSTSSAHSSQYESLRAHDQIASDFP